MTTRFARLHPAFNTQGNKRTFADIDTTCVIINNSHIVVIVIVALQIACKFSFSLALLLIAINCLVLFVTTVKTFQNSICDILAVVSVAQSRIDQLTKNCYSIDGK